MSSEAAPGTLQKVPAFLRPYPRAARAAGGLLAIGARLQGRLEALTAWAERRTLPFRVPLPEPVAYAPNDPDIRRRLGRNAVMGFAGSALILWGASQPTSPFTVKSGPFVPSPPAWFFGLPPSPVLQHYTPPPGSNFYLGLAAFYGGLILLMRAWVRLSRLSRERPGIPLRILVLVMAAWSLPMLFVAPMLSQDAYSYVAQGEMMTRHISPYRYGPAVLGVGANSYTDLTAPIWWNVTSPYGPLFLELAGFIQAGVNHSELAGLVLFRVEALVGVGLIGVSIPRLARSLGRDASAAFVFAVMNPIVLVHLIGGMHNDALMLGLLVAGLALARSGKPVVGTVLVALATLVKVPAALGILYIGWDWLGPGVDWRRRLRTVVLAGAIGLVVMAVVTQLVGLGWGWAFGLGNPDSLRSYLDPATAVGLGIAKLVSIVGLGNHADGFLSIARGLAALTAVALGVRWLWRSEPGASSLRAIGLTMLVAVILGPVMQPWYLAWGVVLLAPVAEKYLRGALVWLTVVVTFLGLGNAQDFVTNLGKANPAIVAVCSVGLGAMLLWPTAPRLRRGLRSVRHPVGDGEGAAAPEEVTVSL